MGILTLFASALLAVAGPAGIAHAEGVTTCTTTSQEQLEVAIGTGTGVRGPKQIPYTCTGGDITNTSIQVGMTASAETVQAGGTFEVTLSIPQLTLKTAVTAATQVQVDGKLTLSTGATVSNPGNKPGGTAQAQSTTVPAAEVKYTVSVAAGTTGKVTVKAGELKLTTGAGGGGTGGENEVWYNCTGVPTGTNNVRLKVTLTMPTNAKTGQESTIGWSATNDVTGYELEAPTTLPTNPKYFAELTLSGGGLTTATAEGNVTVTQGQPITFQAPTTPAKVKPTTAGTVTVKPGSLKIGASSSSPTVNCTLDTTQTNLKSYTFTVTGGSTASNTPVPTKTTTVIVTKTPVGGNGDNNGNGKVNKTPKGGAETGGGGEAGPDGRMFVLTGTALVAAAALGGLVLRRRTARG
ncbi:hypothetical protein [Thermoactinospora rubra]|uniref:hypothetical protein n=1 Tax=Thermoactinospora rubra TaxID=1088767 RepID=UPI00117CF694|nr:hypothetical protein [Thermoactinospora rubra]